MSRTTRPARSLRSFDLNLLVVLDALLAERHVTRAAARLGLSQPATSNALGRLRRLLGDELLVRGRAGMEPTQRGREIADAVRRMLRQVEAALEGGDVFDPGETRRRFRIRMSDLLGRLLLPRLVAHFAEQAPHASLEVVHLSPSATVDALERDEIDLGVSMGLVTTGSILSAELLRDRMVCLLRAGHPAALRPALSLDDLLALRHVRVAMSPSDRRFAERVLGDRNEERHIALTVPHWLVLPEILRDVDLAAVLPESLADAFSNAAPGSLVTVPIAAASTGFAWEIYWHRRHDGSAAHAWLRRLVASVSPALAA